MPDETSLSTVAALLCELQVSYSFLVCKKANDNGWFLREMHE